MSISRGTDDIHTPTYVTRPSLPPLAEFLPYLEQIWSSGFLTNGGQFHEKFEAGLCEYLGVEHVSLVANGTLGLMVALRALNLQGEVITTPFSFVATAHSVLWSNLEPVFVDIDPNTMNLDPAKVEAAITPRTCAILPVHCYGNACDVDGIRAVADRHGLKVVYDAAHAFGVRLDGRSVLQHGDLSVLSFHATKVFNTFEGGAIVSRDVQTKQRIDRLKSFGMVDESTVLELGMNAKMSEFNAALGLLQLQHVDRAIARRQAIDTAYREALADVPGIRCIEGVEGQLGNFSYFPIIVGSAYPLSRDGLNERLRQHNIFARRYFNPLISAFPMYAHLPSAQPQNLPVAVDMASRVLCLPIYPSLSDEALARIIQLIRTA